MQELTPSDRAKIASKAQALAHRQLRVNHPAEYDKAYQAEKERLTAERLSAE